MSRPKRDLALLFLCLILAGAFVLLATPSALATEHLQRESFNATSIAVINGTLNDGQLNSTYWIDGEWYNVSETNGVPGLDIRVNFTGLGTDQTGGCFEFWHIYSGHSSHEIQVQLWNFTDSSWELVGTVLFNETAGWKCVGLSPHYPHYFSGGKLWARFYHATVGHLAHELQIDEIELHVSYPFTCPPPAITDSCAVVDDYTDESGVAGKHQVVRNILYDAMELDDKPDIISNFTEFTEIDPAPGKITIDSATKVSWTQMSRNTERRIYKDYGVGYFVSFIHFFDLTITDVEAGDENNRKIMTLYQLGNDNELENDALLCYIAQQATTDDSFNIFLIQKDGGVQQFIWNSAYYGIGTYYITISRNGNIYRIKIHSDEDRTTLLEDSGNQTGTVENYRYLIISKGHQFVDDPDDHSTGYIESFILEESAYFSSGHFYTTDLLAGIDYTGQAVLLNTTIPGGDTLTVEFSDDNSTWVLNDWEPIFGGYEAIDIRVLAYNTLYLRFNFTDGGADSTPRLLQVKIYHGGPCPSLAEPDTTPYMAIAIILLLFGLMIGSRLKT